MSMNALRSSASAIALRSSALLNGGFSRLMIKLVLTLIGAISQIAVGSCFLMSASSAVVISVGKVMSTLPATKASTAVARLRDDRVLDAVEIRQALFPVVRILRRA